LSFPFPIHEHKWNIRRRETHGGQKDLARLRWGTTIELSGISYAIREVDEGRMRQITMVNSVKYGVNIPAEAVGFKRDAVVIHIIGGRRMVNIMFTIRLRVSDT
uniref:DnaJ_C domain-containing protein n=1 Tax=Haemonchus placei TaxID=6290 RepID=A0A0N4WRE7_HAEPC